MTTPLTKLIEENKWRPIAEAPHGLWLLVTDGLGVGSWMACYSIKHNGWIRVDGILVHAPTHFRPLPDDRLARCFEILLNAALSAKEQNHIYEAAADIEIALQEITAIAEGKEHAENNK